MNGMVSAVKTAYKNIFNYKGRGEKKEFWLFFLFAALFAAAFWSYVLFSDDSEEVSNETVVQIQSEEQPEPQGDGGIFSFSKPSSVEDWVLLVVYIYNIINFLAWLSFAVRRLRDVGKSASWLLLFFVPFGFFLLFVLLSRDSVIEPEAA